MRLVPNDEPLVEFNPCHDPKTGQFATSTQGRCGALTGRMLIADKIRNARATDRKRAKNPLSGRAYAQASYEKAAAQARIGLRRSLNRRGVPGLPKYLHADAMRALKTDRVVTTVDSKTAYARPSARMVGITVHQPRVDTLSFYRHEVGHISPRKINAAMVAGLGRDTLMQLAPFGNPAYKDLTPEYKADSFIEEVRAWRNAIADNGGRVSTRAIRRGLGSYASMYYGAMAPDVMDAVMPTLKRYQRIVKRAARRKGAA